MRRREEEFYCDRAGGGCGKYFKTYLRSNMYGNYTIECPGCQHHHFRVIEEGLVTQDRHSSRLGEAEIILGLKATLRDTPWHDDPDFRRSQLKAYAGGVGPL
jgi:hypothetical protein